MGTIFKFINKIIIFILLFGFITAFVDYYRMINAEMPVFNKVQYNFKTKIQTYKGLFYKAERKILASPDESLMDSSNIKYKLFLFPLNVSLKKKKAEEGFSVFGQGSLECEMSSKLYFADLNVKVYTYCLEDIFVKKKESKTLLSYLEKDNSILDDINNKFGYMGIHQNMMEFHSREKDSLDGGLVMYQCLGDGMNDIYFAPTGTLPQMDFCTYKDDDFAFLFGIVDESIEQGNSPYEKEVFYEDENFIYRVDKNKSNYLFAVVPEIRGKSEKKILLKTALQTGIVTMEQVEKKTDVFEKVSKIHDVNS